MNRLGIFCIFDKEGIIDEYIEYLITDLRERLSKLVIVINGNINDDAYNELKNLADIVMIRKNEGYDAGAYKDALSNHFTIDEIMKCDEMVFCNDSFYGPFVSFKDIWMKMEVQSADFWGITDLCNNYANCIQSYFVVFRKNVLKDMYYYMLKNIDEKTEDFGTVVAAYEVGLYEYLVGKGYKSACYTDIRNTNLFNSSAICIIKYGMPILKKKSFSDIYYNEENIYNTLAWLYRNTRYNIDMILRNVDRIYEKRIRKNEIAVYEGNNKELVEQKFFIAKISSDDIKLFIQSKKEVCIYGVGIIAKIIYFLYLKDINGIQRFIISDNQNVGIEDLYGISICKISEIEDDMPIIVALNEQNTNEVRKYLDNRNHVLYLC